MPRLAGCAVLAIAAGFLSTDQVVDSTTYPGIYKTHPVWRATCTIEGVRISSQLASAGSTQAPGPATSSSAVGVPTFGELFQTATQGETAVNVGSKSVVSSDQPTASTASSDIKAASATDAGSSTDLLSGQSDTPLLPALNLQQFGQAFVTATYSCSGMPASLAKAGAAITNPALGGTTQTPAARTGDTKSKKNSPPDNSAEAGTLPASALANTAIVALPVPDPLPPPPLAPVDDASASIPVLASSADTPAFASDSTSPALPAPAKQEIAGPDAPADAQSPAVTAPVALAAILPATASGDLMADVNRLVAAAATPPKLSTARPGPIPASDAKPAAGETASSKAVAPSVLNGTETIPTPPPALGSTETAAPEKDAPPLASISAVGADRSSSGEVRSKRKDAPADGSVPNHDSSTTAPAPFAARLTEAQASAQAGTNGADATALPKALEGSQPLTPNIPLASAQTNLPSAPLASAPAATPSAPAAIAEPSADPAALPSASSAQLIQSAGQTEMRLGMRSTEFGNISISTSVSHQTISAQISLDHPELGRALAAHLPAIEEKLGSAYGLHARVEVRDESAASRSAADSGQTGGGSQESEGGARGGQSRSGSAALPVKEAAVIQAGSTNLAALSSTLLVPAEGSRLDIRI